MPFSQKLGKFLIFLLLTALTFGLYPLWWIITRIEEQNELLRDIRDGRSRPSRNGSDGQEASFLGRGVVRVT